MSQRRIDPLTEMKNTILDLIGVLKDEMLTHSSEQGDLILVEFFFKRMHDERIMQHVIKHVLPHSKKIGKRKITFFIKEKQAIFAGLPADRVDYYSNILAYSDRLKKDDRDEIWEFFDSIIALAECYKKQK